MDSRSVRTSVFVLLVVVFMAHPVVSWYVQVLPQTVSRLYDSLRACKWNNHNAASISTELPLVEIPAVPPVPQCTVLSEAVIEEPAKPFAIIHLLITGTTEEENIRNLLQEAYAAFMKKRGFSPETFTGYLEMYAYDSREKAGTLWTAMLSKKPGNVVPNIRVKPAVAARISPDAPQKK